MEFKHVSIMLDQVIENLSIKEDGIYVDGTVGGAGHSSVILSHLGPEGRLICLDQDNDAIKTAKERLNDSRVNVVKSNYVNMDAVLNDLDIDKVDGILLDLGVSSYQFDNGDRGFSYRMDAPLDMRMDQDSPYTAEDIINDYSDRNYIG